MLFAFSQSYIWQINLDAFLFTFRPPIQNKLWENFPWDFLNFSTTCTCMCNKFFCIYLYFVWCRLKRCFFNRIVEWWKQDLGSKSVIIQYSVEMEFFGRLNSEDYWSFTISSTSFFLKRANERNESKQHENELRFWIQLLVLMVVKHWNSSNETQAIDRKREISLWGFPVTIGFPYNFTNSRFMLCHQIFPPRRNLFADLINEFLLILAWKFEIVIVIELPQTTEENSITYLVDMNWLPHS